MDNSIRIDINGRTFSKASFIDEAKRILQVYNGEIPCWSEDYDFVYWILCKRRELLFDYGVLLRAYEHTDGWSKCFSCFNKQSQQWEEFSYKKAINSERQNFKLYITQAFRNEVLEQTGKAKDKLLEAKFPETEITSDLRQEYHLDHIYPFALITDEFLSDFDLQLEQIKVEKREVDDRSRYFFADHQLGKLWQDYHLKHAKYQLLTKSQNLAKINNYDNHLIRQQRSE